MEPFLLKRERHYKTVSQKNKLVYNLENIINKSTVYRNKYTPLSVYNLKKYQKMLCLYFFSLNLNMKDKVQDIYSLSRYNKFIVRRFRKKQYR